MYNPDCPKCGQPMAFSHEDYGKPQYRCFDCHGKLVAQFMDEKHPNVISDAHMRRIHMSAMNPNPANCADAVRVCEALDLDINDMERSGVKGISWDFAVKLVDKRDKALSDNATLRTALREAADALEVAWQTSPTEDHKAATKARLAAGGEASGS